MLTKKTPETLKAIATVKHGGESTPLMLTFYNRTIDELTEFTKSGQMTDVPEQYKGNPIPWMNAQVCLFLIKSFDDGTDEDFPLNLEGLLSMESYYPAVLMGIVQLFHQVRGATVEKN